MPSMGPQRSSSGRIADGFEYQSRNTEIRPGEGVLVYTDGVTEASNKKGEFYEESRLEAYLAAHGSKPVDDLVRGLHADVERFAAGARRSDDITVLGLRWLGIAPASSS